MKLSIIIPCYNEANIIKNIVESIRKVSCQDTKIIIVNAGNN